MCISLNFCYLQVYPYSLYFPKLLFEENMERISKKLKQQILVFIIGEKQEQHNSNPSLTFRERPQATRISYRSEAIMNILIYE